HNPSPSKIYTLSLHDALPIYKQSLLEMMRVTRGEARLYPLVTFEATRSTYLDRLREDRELRHLGFQEVQTDFEFLINSNHYLRVDRKSTRLNSSHDQISYAVF